MKTNKIKNWIIGILFAIICGVGIAINSAYNANANSTYVGSKNVTYDIVNVNGTKCAVFIYGNDMEVIKL